MKQKITTFLMFEGKAEEAMNFYTSIFESSEIKSVTRYGSDGEKPGAIQTARFSLNGQDFMCIDSPVEHNFTFTPSISLYINCSTEKEIDTLFEKLSKEGIILMALDKYPFSKKYGWCQDRFGVSWQLSLDE